MQTTRYLHRLGPFERLAYGLYTCTDILHITCKVYMQKKVCRPDIHPSVPSPLFLYETLGPKSILISRLGPDMGMVTLTFVGLISHIFVVIS